MYNMLKKVFLTLFFIVIFIMGLTGCSSKTESFQLVDKYYDNIKNNNLDENYECLSSSMKNIWTKESYKEWQSINEEIFTLKDVKIEKRNEYMDRELEGVKYRNITEYNITEVNHDNYHDKDIESNYLIYVLNENNQWKIYWKEEDEKGKISKAKLFLASMYLKGKGKNKDLNKTENILSESIEENPNYARSYYLLGYMYIDLHRYDEAITVALQHIDKAKNNEEISYGYDVLGLAYMGKDDCAKAKEYYMQAIQANPSDETAKDSLKKFNLDKE